MYIWSEKNVKWDNTTEIAAAWVTKTGNEYLENKSGLLYLDAT
jgi:hypothetical protein